MKTQHYLQEILHHISVFESEVKNHNAAGKLDINLYSENFFIPLFSEMFEWHLKNLNQYKKNYPGIDLADFQNQVAIQITSENSREKIKSTLKKFENYELNKKFSRLIILILGQKKNASNTEEYRKDYFSLEEDLWDFRDLSKMISSISDVECLDRIKRLFDSEFSQVKVEQRKHNYKEGEGPLSSKEEKIYPNLLKIEIPTYLFIGELNFDKETLIEEINQKRREKGFQEKDSYKDEKLIVEGLKKDGTIRHDWVTYNKFLLTFCDINDSEEPLAKFCDRGTVEKLSPEEFYKGNDDKLNVFKYLLKGAMSDYCFKRGMEGVKYRNKGFLIRFRSDKVKPGKKQIRWKKDKTSKKTVINEVKNKELGHTICLRHLAFEPTFKIFDGQWYLLINPTWSFSKPNGKGISKFESSYLSGVKKLEDNSSVYYFFMFFAQYLNKFDIEFPTNSLITIKPPRPLFFSPSLREEKFENINEEQTQFEEVGLGKDIELEKQIFD